MPGLRLELKPASSVFRLGGASALAQTIHILEVALPSSFPGRGRMEGRFGLWCPYVGWPRSSFLVSIFGVRSRPLPKPGILKLLWYSRVGPRIAGGFSMNRVDRLQGQSWPCTDPCQQKKNSFFDCFTIGSGYDSWYEQSNPERYPQPTAPPGQDHNPPNGGGIPANLLPSAHHRVRGRRSQGHRQGRRLSHPLGRAARPNPKGETMKALIIALFVGFMTGATLAILVLQW